MCICMYQCTSADTSDRQQTTRSKWKPVPRTANPDCNDATEQKHTSLYTHTHTCMHIYVCMRWVHINTHTHTHPQPLYPHTHAHTSSVWRVRVYFLRKAQTILSESQSWHIIWYAVSNGNLLENGKCHCIHMFRKIWNYIYSFRGLSRGNLCLVLLNNTSHCQML